MRRPRSAEAKRALEVWGQLPATARLHTQIRWWTVPFEALQKQVPRSGNILEVGCGHGVLSMFLGLTSPDRSIVGVDIDGEKISLAKKAATQLRSGEATVAFEHRVSGDIPIREGGWDAIVFADVLYLLQPQDRSRMLEACAAALSLGGVLIVKEVDTVPAFKARITKFQEFLSTRVLRITHGDQVHFPSAAELETELSRVGLTTKLFPIDKGYFHPHCVVIGTKPTV